MPFSANVACSKRHCVSLFFRSLSDSDLCSGQWDTTRSTQEATCLITREDMENMMSIKEAEEVMTSPAQDPPQEKKKTMVVIIYENVIYKIDADEL